MKKLLSLLTISGVIASSSSTVISCNESSGGQTRVVVDSTKIELGDAVAATNEELFANVRTQIGSYGSPIVTANDIKADTKLGISIWDNAGNPITEDGTATVAGKYDIHLTIEDGDTYFTVMATKTITITVALTAPTAIALTGITFTNSSATKGDMLYTDVYTQIAAKVTANTLTAQQMRTDSTLKVEIKDVKDLESSTVKSGTTYDVTITVSTGNNWFEPTASPIASTIATTGSSSKVTLPASIDAIFITASATTKGEAIYTEIYAALGTLASVDGAAIKSSTGITIAATDYAKATVADNNSATPAYGLGTYTVTVDANNEYFEATSSDSTGEFTVQYDSTKIEFAGGAQTAIATKDALLTDVQTELEALVSAPANTIEADSSITITMYESDGTTEVSDGATSAQTYKIQVVVAVSDAWFSEYDGATKFDLVLT